MNPDVATEPERRWTLAAAVDALGLAARQAGRPGLVWFAGALYPSWTAFEVGRRFGLSFDDGEAVTVGLAAIVIWVLSGRLMSGLARMGHPQEWAQWTRANGRPPGLRQAWEGGRGSTRAALGLWLLISLMLLLVLGLMLGPLGLRSLGSRGDLDPVRFLVLAPITVFLVAYATVLSVLHQLALHSLVRNRRGVGSALTHAWRIARNDPRRTFVAMLPDLLLAVMTSAAGWLLFGVFGRNLPAATMVLAIHSFAGVTRATYWAQAYRALGGLAPEDGVPGLDPSATERGEGSSASVGVGSA